MHLKLYNTETREKESVLGAGLNISRTGDVIRMYTCGPTIYDFAHIGNFRTYVFEDLLRRTLLFFGFKVEQVMNLTDLDDKTIRGAIAKNVRLKEFTEPYRIAFFEDLNFLNIQRAEHYPAATDYIPEMIRLVEILLEKGYAYKGKRGSIYFNIRQFSSYGRLSHLTLEDLKENASGDNEPDEYDKENISDFVLWKAYDPQRDGQIFWDSPFGPGRPGWHIECSAMSMKLLGETIDIHCGGVDNIFPHHENEIAQSEGCTGHRFVRLWLHSEHLLVDHKKMSKSLGNFYTLRDLLKRGYSGAEVRYLLLSTHYRTQLNFTFEGLDAARASLRRIEDLVFRLRAVQESVEGGQTLCVHSGAEGILDKARLRFTSALADDLNCSSALAALFDLVREFNVLCDEKKINCKDVQDFFSLLEQWDQVLAVLPLHKQEPIPEDLLRMLAQREKARAAKDFSLSDQMRDAIQDRGYLIEDTATGARLKKYVQRSGMKDIGR